jgi:hypothetical protein
MTNPESIQEDLHDQRVNRGCLGCLLIFAIPPLLLVALIVIPQVFAFIFVHDQIPRDWNAHITEAAREAADRTRDDNMYNGAYQIIPRHDAYVFEDYRYVDSTGICSNPMRVLKNKNLEIIAFKLREWGIFRQNSWQDNQHWVCVYMEPDPQYPKPQRSLSDQIRPFLRSAFGGNQGF